MPEKCLLGLWALIPISDQSQVSVRVNCKKTAYLFPSHPFPSIIMTTYRDILQLSEWGGAPPQKKQQQQQKFFFYETGGSQPVCREHLRAGRLHTIMKKIQYLFNEKSRKIRK